MGDLFVLARIMFSYMIYFPVPKILRVFRDGDFFPYLLESCYYIFSLSRPCEECSG